MDKLEAKKKELDSLINSLIHQSRDFTWYACYNYGERTYQLTGKKTAAFSYDYDYFNFVKSTKTLISIRSLLKLKSNEDIFILIRSMFESYLSARYFQEHDELVDEFIFSPTYLALAYYNINTEGFIVNRDKEIIGELLNPSKFKIGSDKKYYNDFYAFLCMFAHANYGIRNCYLERSLYKLDKENYPILVRLFTIFVFTKLFESIVTVEGEDFLNPQKEKKCYKLVKDSIKLQKEIFDDVIKAYDSQTDEFTKFKNKRMKEMLKNMKKSLDEEIGSVSKASV